MALNDIINAMKGVGVIFKDEFLKKKIESMYTNAEVYELAGEKEIYDLIKRRCVEEYKRISDPKIKQDVAETIKRYLPNNPLSNP